MVRYVAALLSRRYCKISILCIGVKVIDSSWSSSVESRSNVFVSDWPSPQLALSNWPLEGSFVSILGNFSEPFFRSQQKVLWSHCVRKTNKSSPMLRSFPQWPVVRSLHKEGGGFSQKSLKRRTEFQSLLSSIPWQNTHPSKAIPRRTSPDMRHRCVCSSR